MFKYSVNMAWSDQDECYVATIPEFPYLSAFGDTPEEAAEEAKIAAEGFIEVMREDGEKVPEPQKLKTHSGQTRLRMPVSLHERLSIAAVSEKVSFNTYVVGLLEGRAAREEAFREVHDLVQSTHIPLIEKTGLNLMDAMKRTVAVLSENIIANFHMGNHIQQPPDNRQNNQSWGSAALYKINNFADSEFTSSR